MRNYAKLKEQVNSAVEGAKKDMKILDAIAAEAKCISKIARDVHIVNKSGGQFNITALGRAVCEITTN